MTLMTTKKINTQTKYIFAIYHKGIQVADSQPVVNWSQGEKSEIINHIKTKLKDQNKQH